MAKKRKNGKNGAASPASGSVGRGSGKTLHIDEATNLSDIDRGLHVTKRQVAFFYDVQIGTVTNWLKRGLPISNYYNDFGERLFHIKYVNEWVQKNILKSDVAELARGRTAEDLKLKKLKAEKLQMEIAAKAGVVVDIDFAAEVIRNRLQFCKSRLMALPKRISPRVAKMKDTKKIQQVVHSAVYEAVEELRDVSPSELVN